MHAEAANSRWTGIDSVWNQAYQENGKTDSVEQILENAKKSYVLLDPFDSPEAAEAIEKIKKENNIVSVYMSVGTGENWRSDFARMKSSLVKRSWGEWEGEYFVDRITPELIDVMKKRIDKAAEWGADMVEFDNMDWAFDLTARKKYKFHVTEDQSLAYVNTLRKYAESRGLKCMAKNMINGAGDFAGVTFESSARHKDWWDHDLLLSFLNKGKLCVVFHYGEKKPEQAVLWYKERYGENLLVLVESKSEKCYIH